MQMCLHEDTESWLAPAYSQAAQKLTASFPSRRKEQPSLHAYFCFCPDMKELEFCFYFFVGFFSPITLGKLSK